MSFCTKCGCECSDEAKFCKQCGAQLYNPGFTDSGYYEEPQGSGYYEDASEKPPKAKKKIKWWAIILMTLGGYIVGCLAAGLITGDMSAAFPSLGDKAIVGKTSSVPYTSGTVSNGQYINEWANITFPISDEFPEADESAYAAGNSGQSECGFLSSNPYDGSSLAIEFDDLSSFSSSSITDDKIRNSFINILQSQLDESVALTSSETTKAVIAGEEYSHITVSFEIASFDTSNRFVADTYWRILDKHMIGITIVSLNGEKNDFVNHISAVK